MMDWILPSSASTLNRLEIKNANLTRTPLQLKSFQLLSDLVVGANQADWIISTGSLLIPKVRFLTCSSYLALVSYSSVGASNYISIEAGAFQGKHPI